MLTPGTITTAHASDILAALNASPVATNNARTQGAIAALAGYNNGELLNLPDIRRHIHVDKNGGTAHIRWTALANAIDPDSSEDEPLPLNSTAYAALTFATALATDFTPKPALRVGAARWNTANSQAMTGALAVACGQPDPYDTLRAIRELADAAIADGGAVGIAFGAVIISVLEHGTRITSPDQLREILDRAVIDSTASGSPLRERLSNGYLPWQAPTLTADAAESAVLNARVPAAPQPPPHMGSASTLDDAIYNIVANAHLGAIGLPGILTTYRDLHHSDPSTAVVVTSLERLIAAGRITSSSTDTTTLYRLTSAT